MSDDRFFETKKPAAVLKHAILTGYLPVFVQKTGLTSKDNVVVVVDGYAGEGLYEDGTQGSPLLIADVMRKATGRTVSAIFIESDPVRHAKLTEVLTTQAADVQWITRLGTVSEHTEEILAHADGLPLFVFLDPFGRGIPLEEITALMTRPGHLGAAKTEVLLNFSTVNIWRVGGLLKTEELRAKHARALDATDVACGGAWWREEFVKHASPGEAADAIAMEFMERVCREAKCSGWTVEVRPRQDLLPIYHLQLYTRHKDGMLSFGEAASLAAAKWRRAVIEDRYADDFNESDRKTMYEIEEARLVGEWRAQIRENISGMLNEADTFSPARDYGKVFKGVLGQAREMHLRATLVELEKEGTIEPFGKGKLFDGREIRHRRPSA